MFKWNSRNPLSRRVWNSGKHIFADKVGSNGNNYVWRKRGEELSKTFSSSGQTWCMSASGVGNFDFIAGIMNKHIHVNTLQEHLKTSA